MKDKLDYLHHHAKELKTACVDLELAASAMEKHRDEHQAESEMELAAFKLLEEMVDAQVATAKCVEAMACALLHHMAAHHSVTVPA